MGTLKRRLREVDKAMDQALIDLQLMPIEVLRMAHGISRMHNVKWSCLVRRAIAIQLVDGHFHEVAPYSLQEAAQHLLIKRGVNMDEYVEKMMGRPYKVKSNRKSKSKS